MTKICYKPKKFHKSSRVIIRQAEEIIEEYESQGYDLTLRQLYYQFVARDYISNTQKSYDKLGRIINDARLAGLLSWGSIEDRTRNLQEVSTWESPYRILKDAQYAFRLEKWEHQDSYFEAWVEKDALVGILDRICNRLEIPYMACRGYMSASEMWEAANRFEVKIREGKNVVLLHLGDHDPSGLDMSRDILERLQLFLGYHGFEDLIEVRRIALNMRQVRQYNPPPNPAKVTDSRFAEYRDQHGDESWELDALAPNVISELIEKEIDLVIDRESWDDLVEQEQLYKQQIGLIAERFK